MYRFLVVLVTIATAWAQPVGFGHNPYSSFGSYQLKPQPSFSHFEEEFPPSSYHQYPKISFPQISSYSDNNQFESGKRGQNDQQFQQQHGLKGDEYQQSLNGFKSGNFGARGAQGSSGFFADENGQKQFADDAKHYFGDKRFQQEGKNGAERKAKNGHRKGHSVNGFKKTHNKDESGREENYFDEANDEGEHFNIDAEAGRFGESKSSSFKGAQENTALRGNKGSQKKHYDTQENHDNNERDSNQYGSKKFGANNFGFGSNNGGLKESHSGYSQQSKFSKQQ